MPVYENPNNLPVDLALSVPNGVNAPRRIITIYPRSWSMANAPSNAIQEFEMSEVMAKHFIELGMITRKHNAAECESCRLRALADEQAEKLKALREPLKVDPPAVAEAAPTNDETRKARRKTPLPALEKITPSSSDLDIDDLLGDGEAPAPVRKRAKSA